MEKLDFRQFYLVNSECDVVPHFEEREQREKLGFYLFYFLCYFSFLLSSRFPLSDVSEDTWEA